MALDPTPLDVLTRVINIQWPSIRFIAVDLIIERRPTLEWIAVDPVGRGSETNDYVSLGLTSPPPFDWNFMLTAFRYCWQYWPTTFILDGGSVEDFFDDVDTHPDPVNFYQSNGEEFGENPLHTNWASLADSNDVEIDGLPVLPMTSMTSGFAASNQNNSIFFSGPDWYSPQIEWEVVSGAEMSPLISQPQSLVGGDLYHFKRTSSVKFRMRGISLTGAGITEVPVGFDPGGGPVVAGLPPDNHPSVFDEVTISLSSLRIDYRGQEWKAIAAVHEPQSVSIAFPSWALRPPGTMWLLFVRVNDPDFA